MRNRSLLWRFLWGSFAVLGALVVTFVYPKHNGLDLDLDRSARAQEVRKKDPYDLSQQRVLLRTVMQVTRDYVEPERINWRKMMLAGLYAVQRQVAPVLIHYEDGADKFTVQVHDQKREFRIGDVVSPWKLTERFGEVFKFLQPNLDGEDVEPRDVEYAAVNGMLRTLDPHTVLLTPDVYEEMRTSTRGEFGGLGIVISIREDQLTVIKPMENTPASRAGLKRGDKIVQIDDEVTLNMPLNEAVDRLRGAPGSDVEVWITRPGKGGFAKAKKISLTRAVIQIPSVQSKMLSAGVGYVHIESFQGNTDSDLEAALEKLRQTGMKGLVLDLRDDPGGLLEQAVRVSDLFLTSGTIVVTSSNDPSDRDEKFARADGTEPPYPMVVLVNGRSASASEIVAGALKGHDRALIVGERTFGKGSVQVLYDFEDGSALKLTIAQYLTPGDVSIQEVGIVPDIAIDPMTVDPEDMDLTLNTNFLRESDLGQHLTSDRVRSAEQPSATLHYALPAETRRRLREADPQDDEENEREQEFLLRFAQTLLGGVGSGATRVELLSSSKKIVADSGAQEMKRVAEELKALGVDWSAGDDKGASDVDVSVSTDRPDNRARAGEPFALKVKVTNKGKAPLYQLRATTKSDFGLFHERELIFGKVMPGQTREWTAQLGICQGEGAERRCAIPRNVLARADGIKIKFEEAHGHAPAPVEVRTTLEALPRPSFAYAYQLADSKGNGNGFAERGESLTLYFRVRNTGVGPAFKTATSLRNLSGRGLSLKDGRFSFDSLAPGAEQEVAFTFDVLGDIESDEIKLEVAVYDTELREGVTEKITIPLKKDAPKLSAGPGPVVVDVGATLLEAPASSARAVATVEGGTATFPATATTGDFVRVDVGNGRAAWVDRKRLKGGAQNGGKLAWLVARMPPQMSVDHGNTFVTKDASLKLKASAKDDHRVRDMYVFVGPRKVFYDASRANAKEMAFETKLPLRPGMNYVTVVAREDQDVVSRRTFAVRRDGPDGALLESPKHSADDWAADEFVGEGIEE
jgi:carboxyl-terminal processing protease